MPFNFFYYLCVSIITNISIQMKKSLLSLLILLVSITFLSAQNQILPIDSAVRKGVLPNGLTYYIRHNQQPKQRAEFHIAQNVGAILENDDQNGLAHFLEHMAFNGSENFPDKLIINYFESIGVSFGRNINAYTALDETVYRLSDVPTIREGIIDSALLVLYDWSTGISLLEQEIDNERGVILAEWRTGANANRRMWKASNAQKYAGSQYAKRDVIGDTAVINNFTYQALRDYYEKWYGPDLQAIIVVGDIDVDKMEQKIIDLFSKIEPRENRGERPIYYLQDRYEPLVSIVTDKEAQNSRITMEFISPKMQEKVGDVDIRLVEMGYKRSINYNLMSKMFSYRFDALALDPNANFLGAYVGYDETLKKGNTGLVAITIPKEGKEREALRDLYSEVTKVGQHGFTNAEFERAKTDMLNDYEKAFNDRESRQNITLAREYIRNYLDNEPIPGIEWEYDFVKTFLSNFKIENINNGVKYILADRRKEEDIYQTDFNKRVIVALQAPEKEGINLPSKDEVKQILIEVLDTKFDAPIEENIAKNLVDKVPKAGKIKQTTKNSSLGTTEWLLSNGVKVVFKPTEFKKDEILFRAVSWGGQNKVATKDLASAIVATNLIQYSGLGKFSYTDLQKALTGKTASVYGSISDNNDNMNGNSSVKDFETLLQMIYLYFQEPRNDEKAFQTMIEYYKNSIANREKNPKAIFSDSLSMIWTCRDERTLLMNNDFLSKINHQKALEIFKQRFAAANDFTFIFTGNINPEDKNTQKLILTWLGGMKKGATEEYTPLKECRPEGSVTKHFTAPMEIDNTTNAIRYHSPMEYNWESEMNMTAIGKVLNIRYLESVREREGGSYGVGVSGVANKLPEGEAFLRIQFDCNPDKKERLLEIIHEEINEIIKDGVRADDLQKVKESMLKDFEENLEKNNYLSSVLAAYYIDGMNYIADYRNAVNALTTESVQNMLKKLVASGNVLEVSMEKEK